MVGKVGGVCTWFEMGASTGTGTRLEKRQAKKAAAKAAGS